MKLAKCIITLAFGVVIPSINLNLVHARDTDIYYTDPSATTVLVKPNLLMMLDTTGSMNQQISGTTQNRLDVMKEALLTVLDNTTNVNVGLGRFSGGDSGDATDATTPTGAAILYPVKDLEATVTNTGRLIIPVQNATDDAEESGTGTVTTNESTLNLGSMIVGVRFRNAFIPQLQNVAGAVTSAKLVFKRVSGDDTNAATFTISADNLDNTPTYSTTTNNITSTTVRPQTTTVTWTDPTITDAHYESPDISDLVKAVVSRSGWCRGNAIGFTVKRTSGTGTRNFAGYDTYGSDTSAAYLVVSYDPSKIQTTGSCEQVKVISRIAQSTDDAEQRVTGGGDMTLNTTLQLPRSSSNEQYIGLRFRDIKIPQGATITSAVIDFVGESNGSSSAPSILFRGIKVTNAVTFSGTQGDISNTTNRPITTSSVIWSSLSQSSANTVRTTPELKTIVQEIVNQTGWVNGNAMAFRLERDGSGSTNRNFHSWDSKASSAPLLRISYALSDSSGFVKTVRDELKEIIISMKADGATGIVDALYESALYYRGNAVNFGKIRGYTSTSSDRRWLRISHAGTYTGGTVTPPTGCTANDPNAMACVTEQISDSPVYTTPIAYSCQSNHIMLLTDGTANVNSSATNIRTLANVTTCSDDSNDAHRCGTTLTNFLNTKDQSTTLSDGVLQTVTTHTVGFAFSSSFLTDLATNGGGTSNTANNEAELVDVFKGIFNDILDKPTSFVSPSLSVNAFNRLYNRDEVYFSLFTPQLSKAWPGNLKKYKLCAGGSCIYGEVMDYNSPSQSAIGSDSKIKSTARSDWSSAADGPIVTVGGAGEQVPTYSGTSRRVYTYTGTFPPSSPPVDLTAAAHSVAAGSPGPTNNASLTKAMLGNPAMSDTERQNIINWMRGQDLEDEDSDSDTSENRWKYSDSLHSRPATITYGGTAADPAIKIVIGTNDGAIRMIDAKTGVEDWIVYLPEFLDDQVTLKDNANGPHFTGVDGTPTVRVVDVNGDGIIKAAEGDKVQLFIGMRRGGNYIYAFDITPDTGVVITSSTAAGTIKPKLMWRIDSSTTGFGVMGQTWSRPQLTKVWVKCKASDTTCDHTIANSSNAISALMFGGGYDPAFDDTKLGGSGEGMGNAIFMINPDTGSRLWWAGGPSSGADLELANMKYSIPSDLALMDSNRDGVTDRIYVGDLHGQLWRVDLSDQIDPTANNASQRNGGSTGFVFADIGCKDSNRSTDCSGTPNQHRRAFFYPPDVAQVVDDVYASTSTFDYVTIGTGDREDPLDKKTKLLNESPVYNRIYAFRDVNTQVGPLSTLPAAITDANLYDASANTLSNTTDTTAYDAALTAIRSSKGWFIDLKETTTPTWIGEKVLARTTIFGGILYVTTYVPPQATVSTAVCAAPAEGTAKLYALNLLNATGMYNSNGDRSDVIGGGIPSEMVVVIREGGTSGLVGTSGGAKLTQPPRTLPQRRTYWYQE